MDGEAEREWQRLLAACARGDSGVLLSTDGAAALRAAGGWVGVAYAGDEYDLAKRRQEFVGEFVARRKNAVAVPVPARGAWR